MVYKNCDSVVVTGTKKCTGIKSLIVPGQNGISFLSSINGFYLECLGTEGCKLSVECLGVP